MRVRLFAFPFEGEDEKSKCGKPKSFPVVVMCGEKAFSACLRLPVFSFFLSQLTTTYKREGKTIHQVTREKTDKDTKK